MFIVRPTLLLLALLALPAMAIAGTEKRVNASGTSTAWISTGHNLSLELIPIGPDTVRAMYGGKNFPKPLLETIAAYCVMGSIIRNETDAALSYDMADWHVVARGDKPLRPRTKDEWLVEWRQHGVDFSYSLLPAAQTFEPGDWGQGMITVKLPRNTVFDFTYSWMQHGKQFSATIEGVQCAKDVAP